MSFVRDSDIIFDDDDASPICPHCGRHMALADDHGRFICFCQGIGAGIRNNTFDAVSGVMLPPPPSIAQVGTTEMTDEQKAKIHPIHRLHSTPTAAEAKLLGLMLKGPAAMDDPEYDAARRAVDAERK